METERNGTRYQETVNRVVEFSLAYRVATMAAFVGEAAVAEPVVTADRFPDPELLNSKLCRSRWHIPTVTAAILSLVLPVRTSCGITGA